MSRARSQKEVVQATKTSIKFLTTALSNFNKQRSYAHFVAFLFYYNCKKNQPKKLLWPNCGPGLCLFSPMSLLLSEKHFVQFPNSNPVWNSQFTSYNWLKLFLKLLSHFYGFLHKWFEYFTNIFILWTQVLTNVPSKVILTYCVFQLEKNQIKAFTFACFYLHTYRAVYVYSTRINKTKIYR